MELTSPNGVHTGALLSTEPRTRLHAVFFWQARCGFSTVGAAAPARSRLATPVLLPCAAVLPCFTSPPHPPHYPYLWQSASAWEGFAEALAKSIFAVNAVREAGIPHSDATYTAGLAVMSMLADSGAHLTCAAAPDGPFGGGWGGGEGETCGRGARTL